MDNSNYLIRPRRSITALASFGFPLCMLLSIGCAGSTDTTIQEKKPRPVIVQKLTRQRPPASAMVSASVASWKTEQIGFEVSGRIEWVAEPNTDIEGRVVDADGNQLFAGTPVARVESERYELQVETAKAEVERAEQSVNAALIEIEKSIPSQMRAAEADRTLAETEFERSKKLFEQNAGAKADVDRDRANSQSATSKIEQLRATSKAKEAELRSLKLQVRKAKQTLRDAERSLEDCTLYSSFRGQIAEVSVVPGSVVSPGQPVATIQMMDPIKIEVEVSAEDSRRLRRRQRLDVRVPLPDGTSKAVDGFLYLIDPVADPATRTFTLTLLMLNEKNITELPESIPPDTPVTDQPWRLDFSFLPGAEEGMTFAAEDAVRQDEDGHFLWRINNFKIHETMPNDGVIKVSKLRVRLGDSKLPFLGNWVFQQVHILDDSFDPKSEMVAGKLVVKDGDPDDWDGDSILVDRSNQWMARPGDLVKVDLSNGNAETGYFVPMDAIARSAGKTYLFLAERSGDEVTVSRQEVSLQSQAQPTSSTSSLMRIEAIGSQSLEGKQFVTRGVHYLRDGEKVRVTQAEGEEQ